MLVDFKKSIPSIKVAGVDLSEYAISNSHPIVSQDLIVGNAVQLPFDNDSFELVVSINTLHNLKKIEIKKALQEIERIGYKNKFIMVDGYESELEKEMMNKWVLTAETVLSYREWEDFFSEVGYTGDYDFWTVS
jgi:ubiquinone/menaquinone biosynthesis C-methylase UbiE